MTHGAQIRVAFTWGLCDAAEGHTNNEACFKGFTQQLAAYRLGQKLAIGAVTPQYIAKTFDKLIYGD